MRRIARSICSVHSNFRRSNKFFFNLLNTCPWLSQRQMFRLILLLSSGSSTSWFVSWVRVLRLSKFFCYFVDWYVRATLVHLVHCQTVLIKSSLIWTVSKRVPSHTSPSDNRRDFHWVELREIRNSATLQYVQQQQQQHWITTRVWVRENAGPWFTHYEECFASRWPHPPHTKEQQV